MTKKDYELFANEVFKLYDSTETGLHKGNLIRFLSNIFEKDNPLFQADKFERACYEGKHIRKSIKGGL